MVLYQPFNLNAINESIKMIIMHGCYFCESVEEVLDTQTTSSTINVG